MVSLVWNYKAIQIETGSSCGLLACMQTSSFHSFHFILFYFKFFIHGKVYNDKIDLHTALLKT